MKRSMTRTRQGFTIVELIVAIVVVAILAAVVVVAYNGIQSNAREVGMKSDLSGAATDLAMDYRRQGAYPASANLAVGGKGLTTSEGNTFTYATRSYGYCISVTNTKNTKVFRIESTEPEKIVEGVCPPEASLESVVSTVAGSTTGFQDGTGTAARFNALFRIAVNSAGVLYAPDFGNNRVRQITAAGVVTTFTGSGTASSVDGTGTAATHNSPYGIAIDNAGNAYVSDSATTRIRKITPAGVVTTLAGSTAGYNDGTGSAAQFGGNMGLAVDTAGNVYVADSANHRVRKVTPAGVVTTLAGSGTAGGNNGTGTAAQFNSPSSIAVNSSGTVYVAEAAGHRIRQITPAGVVTTLAGSGTSGYADATGTAAQFAAPHGLAIDSAGTLYVSDFSGHRVRKITPAGVVTTVAGTGVAGTSDGTASTAQFNGPQGIAVDSNGIIYVSDYNNRRIRKIQ